MWRATIVLLLCACGGSQPSEPAAPASGLALLVHEHERGLSWWRDGARTPIPNTARADTFAWDARRREILITEGGTLRAIAPTGDRTLLTIDGTLRFPAIAPDGRIVVSLLAAGDAHDRWQLLELPDKRLGPGYLPAFCPDGTMYFERHDGGPHLWTWPPTAREPRFVIRPGHTARCTPDGRRVLLTQRTLVSLDRASGALAPLTAHYDRFASLTADGKTLVVARMEPRALVAIDLATGRERVVLPGDITALLVD